MEKEGSRPTRFFDTFFLRSTVGYRITRWKTDGRRGEMENEKKQKGKEEKIKRAIWKRREAEGRKSMKREKGRGKKERKREGKEREGKIQTRREKVELGEGW